MNIFKTITYTKCVLNIRIFSETKNLALGIRGLEFGVRSLEFGVWSLEFGVWGLGLCFAVAALSFELFSVPGLA